MFKIRLRHPLTAAIAIGALAAATAAPAAASSDLTSFESPSGNIACELSDFGDGTSARCDIRSHTFHMPKPHDCPLDYGDSAEVGLVGKGGVTCHGDTTFGTHRVLAYGRSLTFGPFTCTSGTSGITCTENRTRHGFFISRASYRLF